MRLVFVSDTHRKLNHVKKVEGDILFHCGDHLMFDRGSAYEAGRHLSDYPCQLKVVIAGNHDLPFMVTEGAAVDDMFTGFSEGEEIGNLVYLRDNTINAADHGFEPMVIHGSPWQPWFHDWAFNFPRDPGEYEEFANRVYSLIPEDVDVLITHGPPRKILDGPEPFVTPSHRTVREVHHGCRHLLRRVLEVKPKIHAFGHVHTGRGVHQTKDTLFINCAVIQPRTYLLKYEPFVVDWEDGIPTLVKE